MQNSCKRETIIVQDEIAQLINTKGYPAVPVTKTPYMYAEQTIPYPYHAHT